MVSTTVEECASPSCSFTENDEDGNSYTTTPKNGTVGADWATTLNLPGLRISCEFAPFYYSDLRQPNAVWYVYDDGGTSSKTNVIVIDKSIVQVTPENGASKYRVCYTSPVRFRDRTGNLAQPDPWPRWPDGLFRGDLVHGPAARLRQQEEPRVAMQPWLRGQQRWRPGRHVPDASGRPGLPLISPSL